MNQKITKAALQKKQHKERLKAIIKKAKEEK